MKGADSKAPDLFSNASLLSMLSRSQSSTRSSGAKGVVPPQSTRKKSDKEIPSTSAVARKLSPPPSTSLYKQKECTERISNGPNIYQIGAEIGRGAFAVVYQAFNVETGDFVAVKRFPLTAIDDESLSSIQSEIELMQRLNHPNIVKYIDTIRTERYLYIVIEYIENGSLSTVLKKFGSFSEPLVAIYVTQILRGLKYLHEQGALHRDIKGANILTTKDGLVKLADFGVAIKLTEGSNIKRKGNQEDSHDVVGSPYWIAPEIIEMATPTAACDIWSVGCTIIELLTGKPPYYSRAPMAALFSIVQDPHPPLPDGISTPIKDFLLLCFQKEPSIRSSAAVLLSHPWLQQAVQIHSSPKKVPSPPKSDTTTKNNSPVLSSAVNSPLSSKNSETGDSRCAFAESSPPADRSERNSDGASFSDTMISPRFEMSPRFSIKEEVGIQEMKRADDDGKEATRRESVATVGLETSTATTDFIPDITDSKDAVSKPQMKVNAAGVGSSLVGLFDSDGDACPVPRGVALRRNSANLNDRSDRSSVTRMMSFELPDEREGSSGWNSLDSVDNVIGWSPVKMLSKKQMSSVTVSCSSLLPSRPLSSSQSSANGSAFEDDEDEVESTKVRAARSLPLPRRYSLRSQNALSSVYSEDRTLQDRDEDSFNDMRLSIDDEVDERRGLYILRKALKSGNFLDHDATPDESEGEGNLIPPKLRLSLDQPHGLQGEDGLDTNSLDLELNMRIRQTDSRSVASYDGFDDITTVLDNDDDEYFEGTDSKDVHMNRSREIVTIMSKISSNCEKKEATACCSKLLDIFSMYPDIKEHLVTHFGATPILEMFEATQSCPQTLMSHLEIRSTRSSSLSSDGTSGAVTNSSEFTADVLRVVNKIMEGSIRCQEELTMMGILPGVMRLLQEASRAIAGVKSREKLIATQRDKMPSYTALAFSSFLPHSMQSAQLNVDHSKAVIEIDQSAMEAARFIHLICSSSSLTLQLLVGAGGLSALVNMISFSALMCNEGPGGDSLKKLTVAPKVATDTTLLECKSDEPLALICSNARNSAPSAPEDAKLMVFMGVDCVTEVLLEQSSRARDYCRLFVKLGLLRHISRAFDCINGSLRRTPNCCSPSCHAFQKKRWGGTSGTSRCSSLPCLKGHERKPSDMSDYSGAVKSASLSLLSTECNLECGYLNNISNIFLKFSRSDATVALRMAGDSELIQTMMAVLKDPGLSNPLWSSCGKASASSTESKTSHESGSTVGTSRPGERRKLVDLSACGISPCSADIVETLLKCLKNLSMESNALADLEKAGTISILIPLLDGPLSDRCKNHIVPCIFNLCRINKRRQEEAAVHGVIPHLQTLIVNDSHLKQYALPILCSLAYTSPITRAELLRHGGAAFYINLLKEAYWQTFALNSLAVWLANDTEYMENQLVEPTHLARLVDFFRTASPQTIRVLHNPFLDMMSKSSALSKALSSSGLYVTSLVKRLSTSDAIVLRSLLKMVQLLHQNHPNPRHFVLDNDLYNVAKGFAQSEGQVLVHQVANRLLIDFQNSTLT